MMSWALQFSQNVFASINFPISHRCLFKLSWNFISKFQLFPAQGTFGPSMSIFKLKLKPENASNDFNKNGKTHGFCIFGVNHNGITVIIHVSCVTY